MEEEKKNKPHVFAKRKFGCNMLYPLTESSCLYMMAFTCHWINQSSKVPTRLD